MKTKQLALDALKNCADSADVHDAITTLEADIAQPVEPFAWAWEVLPDSPIQKRQGAKSGVYLNNPSELGIDINGKESTSNYKWTLLYKTPPEPAVNAELLEALEWAKYLAYTSDKSCQEAKWSVDKALDAVRGTRAAQVQPDSIKPTYYVCHPGGIYSEANPQPVQPAPQAVNAELLDALKDLIACAGGDIVEATSQDLDDALSDPDADDDVKAQVRAFLKARAAIAKATS